MSDALERFANRLSDQDWAWWPFLRLRPAPERPMTSGAVARIALAFGPLAGLLLGAALVAIEALSGAAPVPARIALLFVGSIVATTAAMFVVYRLTFAVAWNRRAKRLSAR